MKSSVRKFVTYKNHSFFPSAIFYLTSFYTRHEISKRIGLFYMMVCYILVELRNVAELVGVLLKSLNIMLVGTDKYRFVANAFSGLIAWSVFQWHRKLYVSLALALMMLSLMQPRIGNIYSSLKAP